MKILKALIVILLVSFIFTYSLASAGSKLDLESATEYDYPPFSVTVNGEASGFSVDLLKSCMQ